MLAAVSLLNGISWAQADEPEGTTLRLSGGVTHSDNLQPLPADERVGAVVSPAAAAPGIVPRQPKQRPPAQQVIAPTFMPPNQARSVPSARYPLPVPPAQHYQQQQIRTNSSQSMPKYQSQRAQYEQALQAQQQAQSQRAQQQQAQSLHASQSAQSQQAAVNMLAQLNAHVSTAGSPQAPKLQVLPPNQGQGARLQVQAGTLDPGALYRKNLQAIASLDLQHSGRNQILQAGAQSVGPSVKVEVPFWLAGQWVRSESNESSRVELPSGKALKAVGKQKAAVTDVFGMGKDASGKVWMVVPLHNRGSVDRGIAIDRSQVNKYELILTGKTSALIKVEASHSVIDKKTHKVIQAYQDEEFNEYSLVSDGLVKTESSVKVFDQMGRPKLLTRAVSMEKRTRKF
jgi:hypothetical protein